MTDRRKFLKITGTGAWAAPSLGSLLVSTTTKAAPKPKIRIGQIGTKHAHASGKITTIRKYGDLYDLVGVVEPDEERRQVLENSAAYRGVTWLTEEQLLNTPGLQVVAIETEVCNLLTTAARCVTAGMHIHLDKPAGESLSQFKEILDNATRQGRIVQMGYMYRYNPGFQFIFQAIQAGWLGEVFEAHAVMSKTVSPATRQELAEYEGGTMFELGCHLIDALILALGKPDRVTPFIRRTRAPQDNLADNMMAVFEYPQATATVRSAVMEVDGFRRRQFVVCGNRGTASLRPLEPPQLVLTLDRAQQDFSSGTQKVPLPPLTGRYDGDFADLAQVIHGDKEHDFSPAHDLAVQEAILTASGLPLT